MKKCIVKKLTLPSAWFDGIASPPRGWLAFKKAVSGFGIESLIHSLILNWKFLRFSFQKLKVFQFSICSHLFQSKISTEFHNFGWTIPVISRQNYYLAKNVTKKPKSFRIVPLSKPKTSNNNTDISKHNNSWFKKSDLVQKARREIQTNKNIDKIMTKTDWKDMLSL